MLLFIVFFLAHFVVDPPRSYQAWHGWMMSSSVSLITAVFFAALFAHAWVGLRDVILDYIHPFAVRAALLVLLGFGLTAMGVWVMRILWTEHSYPASTSKQRIRRPTMHFSIFRYNPERDAKPYMQDFHVDLEPTDSMLLDVILRIKVQDDSLTIRKSCREGVCGSDAININGRNGLACVTRVRELKEPVELRPLPSFPVIRDLVVDMTQFFKQYHSIKPYLVNDEPAPEKERLQSPEERDKLNGSYECILCACCTSQCPSSWWNPDKFVGPAGLIQAYRFISDSRDRATQERLDDLNNDPYRLFRCRTIMNCTEVCPRGLSPSRAIERIRLRMLNGRGPRRWTRTTSRAND